MNELSNKLLKYDLFYGIFEYFVQTEYHRDFLLYINTINSNKIVIKLKGAVSMNYISRVTLDNFSLDESLLIKDLIPPYLGYHWGIRAFEINDWCIEEDFNELKGIQKNYLKKLYKISFEVSSANISFIFHDLEVEEVN